ncbi:hypothetical protein [Fontivita pretiosa]|uniref:hypothetical protein n=1 Tax=Fontivita pretiosa TaxID=2989684 RepID=UPI003D176E53
MDDTAIDSLPDDPQTLKRLLIERERRIGSLAQERDAWQIKFLRAEMELLRLRKWYYAPKADQLSSPQDLAQMLLGFAEELESRPLDLHPRDLPGDAEAADEVEAKTARRVRRGRGRRKIAAFEKLPVTGLGQADRRRAGGVVQVAIT